MNTATTTNCDPFAELTAAVRLGKKLATTARADLEAATPILIDALRHDSGQSEKTHRILWSCWSDTHAVSLCDALAGLDADLANAVVAMVSARAHLGGDADGLLRKIIRESDSKPPAAQ